MESTIGSSNLPCLLIFLLFTLAPPRTSANCTSWTSTLTSADGFDRVSSYGFIALDNLACPSSSSSSSEKCTITRKSYDITAPRRLNISVSDADINNIFDLASVGFGPLNADSNSSGRNSSIGNETTLVPFISRDTTVTSLDISDSFVEVEPGKNKTLGWTPYLLYSHGRLGGCSNESLNGVSVMATAPYLMMDSRNETFVGGRWMAFSKNVTEDENVAGKMRTPGNGGKVTAAMVVIFVMFL